MSVSRRLDYAPLTTFTLFVPLHVPIFVCVTARVLRVAFARASASDADSGLDSSDSDGDAPTLSEELLAELRPEARAALEEALAAKNARKASAAAARSAAGGVAGAGSAGVAGVAVSEDWHLSQFWYSADTSRMLAAEVLRAVDASGRRGPIACLSCPSTHAALVVRAP
jgi:hypothetical protein